MDLLTAFHAFSRVAESGSFSAVAREMGTTQPAISRQIAALERHLGVRLLHRSTRALALTEDGRDLLVHAARVLEAVEEAEGAIGRRRASPAGLVRLGCSVAFGRLFIAPRMRALLDRHPELSIDLALSDGMQDLVSEGLDIAVRIGEVDDTTLVARRIGTTNRLVLASAEYLERCGEAMREAVLAGLGIGFLPAWVVPRRTGVRRGAAAAGRVAIAAHADPRGISVAPASGAAHARGHRLPGGRVPPRSGGLDLRRGVTGGRAGRWPYTEFPMVVTHPLSLGMSSSRKRRPRDKGQQYNQGQQYEM
jgi:DNA-binding transcriptional LysR family regulator